jgi:hypothetical protein
MRRTIAMRCAVVAASLVLAGVAASCDDDNDASDAVDEAREDIEDAVGSAGARGAAEAMRAALEATDLEGDETVRDVAVLQENADDVPGSPTVTGIEDADGDGKDDDGKVQLAVGDQEACVTVSDSGEIDVSGEAC